MITSQDQERELLAGGERTLNRTGYMTGKLDSYSQEFIAYAATIPEKVVDIGACYGVATLPALAVGVHVIATDNDPRHLEILHSRTPLQQRERLACKVGFLPNGLDFSVSSISAILCCRVLHLLRPEEIELALQNMYNWLRLGGRIYLINDTPYARYSNKMLAEFLPLHEDKKRQGIKWPGYIENLHYYLQPEFHSLSPDFVTLIDVDAMVAACVRCGFKIIKAEYIARLDYPPHLQNDGRENSGVIAEKIVKSEITNN